MQDVTALTGEFCVIVRAFMYEGLHTHRGASKCHDTVSRLVLCRRCLVIGYSYILNNFVVYRERHLIGPFECAVYARKRPIGQAPLY